MTDTRPVGAMKQHGVTWLRDLGQASVQHAVHHRDLIPGRNSSQPPRLGWSSSGAPPVELDAQVPAAGKPGHQHRRSHPKMTGLSCTDHPRLHGRRSVEA